MRARSGTGGVHELLSAEGVEGRGEGVVVRLHKRAEEEREIVHLVVVFGVNLFIILEGAPFDCEEDRAARERHVHLG